MLTVPLYEDTPFTAFSAWDNFSGVSGALSGDALKAGGTWTTSGGDADDFQNDGNGRAVRTTTLDSGTIGGTQIGRLARAASVSLSACVVQVDVAAEYASPGSDSYQAHVVSRYVDTSNLFYVSFVFGLNASEGWTFIVARKMVGGAETEDGDFTTIYGRPGTFATWTLRVLVDTTGRFFVWMFPQGTPAGRPVLSGAHAALATGGALATGQPGFGDGAHGMSATGSRVYENFAAWVPAPNAAMFASQSCQIGTDGCFREDSTGTAWAPVPDYGDIARIPVAGPEGRTTETFVKASRGNFDEAPDSGIDNISVRPFYRPSWLFVS